MSPLLWGQLCVNSDLHKDGIKTGQLNPITQSALIFFLLVCFILAFISLLQLHYLLYLYIYIYLFCLYSQGKEISKVKARMEVVEYLKSRLMMALLQHLSCVPDIHTASCSTCTFWLMTDYWLNPCIRVFENLWPSVKLEDVWLLSKGNENKKHK